MMTIEYGLKGVVLATVLALVPAAYAQNPPTQDVMPMPVMASQGEIDALLAPVALYPDALLNHVLIASTQPFDVIKAARWSQQNANLAGEAALAAVQDFDWHPSVKALAAFPDLLARMVDDLDWLQRLGEVYEFQPNDMLAAVQNLRTRAFSAGTLQSAEHIRVVREVVEDREVIVIEPVSTRVVHVPVYDTRVVYGAWSHPAYAPVYWHRPVGYVGASVYWSRPYSVYPSFWSYPRVIVVNPRYRHPPRRSYAPVYRPGPHPVRNVTPITRQPIRNVAPSGGTHGPRYSAPTRGDYTPRYSAPSRDVQRARPTPMPRTEVPFLRNAQPVNPVQQRSAPQRSPRADRPSRGPVTAPAAAPATAPTTAIAPERIPIVRDARPARSSSEARRGDRER